MKFASAGRPRGLSQAELGAAVGVTRQVINAIMCERYDPSLKLAFELAVHFDCAVEDLFDSGTDDGE